jgi:hypothetical protein
VNLKLSRSSVERKRTELFNKSWSVITKNWSFRWRISGISRKLGILAYNPAFQRSYEESIPAISQNCWVLRILRLNQLKLHISQADPSQKRCGNF